MSGARNGREFRQRSDDDMTSDDTTQLLQRMATLLTDALDLADRAHENVIAAKISHALELTMERLARKLS